MSSQGEIAAGTGAGVSLPAHLYVHVPLCRSKCAYCDFFSVADDSSMSHADLVANTALSAAAWHHAGMVPTPLDTLYVGGGTPTLLGQYLCVLVGELAGLFALAPGAEITVEANPDSLDVQLIRDLRDVGVTRISIGVQSLDDDVLRWLGRAHDADQALEAVIASAGLGLETSADLICGLPGVTDTGWRGALEAVVECGADHVSVYPLTVEEGTPLASAVARRRVVLPDEDAVASQLQLAEEVLSGLGLERYETSNRARSGHESRHNLAYWTGRPYLGVGGGAHGMLDAAQARAAGLVGPDVADVGRVRYETARRLVPSAFGKDVASIEVLTRAETLREDAMLGLRLAAGISEDLATKAQVTGVLEGLEADGLVRHEDGTLSTTARGWLLGNEVFGRVWNSAG